MRPDVLHPIPKEITSIRENLEERKRTFEQCFLVQVFGEFVFLV